MLRKNFGVALALLFVAILSSAAFADVKTLDDLKTAKIGVQTGASCEMLLRDFTSGTSADILTYENIADIVNALKDGSIDAAVMDDSPARYFAAGDEKLRILPEALQTSYYAIAFRRGDSLRARVNKALDDLKADGTLTAILARHIDETPSNTKIDYNKRDDNRKLWVGCAASFPPYELRTENGFFGIDIELCAEIAKKLDMELVIADYRFDALVDALLLGKIDMICSGFTINSERELLLDFSQPYDLNRDVVMVRAE